ncbi:hypothetical protein ACQ4PT_004900 [Festuca glaucescens]
METLMNLLQETALNHVMSSGLAGDGFGATRQMSFRKLIWVVTRINIQVDKYSQWGDVVEIDTWVASSGKNGMRRDWIIRDCRTKKMIARATNNWVMMNRETRRLSKIPEESVPLNVLVEYHLTSMTLDYRHECRQSQLLESLTTMSSTGMPSPSLFSADLQSTHLIRQQDDKAEIVRARAEWRCKEHH